MPTKLTEPDPRLNVNTVLVTRHELDDGKYSETIRVPAPFFWEPLAGSRNRVSNDRREWSRVVGSSDVTVFYKTTGMMNKYFFKWLRIE